MIKRLLLALLLSMPAAAQQAGLSGSVPEGVRGSTLPNGLRIVVIPDHLAPVVSTALNYLVGSNDGPDGFPGTAHALEHMMFRGSQGLDRDQLSELGALLGGNYNANTTETVTQYTYTVPSADLGLALRSEAARMRGALITQADWEQERGAINQEVSRDLSDPFYNYSAQALAVLFAGTPYEHDALGTRPSFERTDAVLLREFYDRWYAPNNAILVIAGDVDPDAALREAEAVFGPIPTRPVPAHAPFTLGPLTPQTLEVPTNLSVGLVTLAYRMPGLRSPDFAAADILGDVIGSTRSELQGLVPAGKALSAQFSYQPKAEVGQGLVLAAFPAGGDPAPLLAELRRIVRSVAEGGISAELVEASKKQELAQLAFENDSISGLARIWSRALATQGMASPEELAQAYAKVTVEDVKRLARELLSAEAVTGILTPQPGSTPPSRSSFGAVESFAAAPDHPVTLPDWAAQALLTPTAPPPVAPPDVSVLPNGLKLIVVPQTVSHTVSVFGRVRQVTELQQPPGQEGVAALTDRMFAYGTQTRGRIALQTALDELAAQEFAGSSFSLKVLTPQFAAGMALLAEHELRPAFPEEGFRVARSQLAQSVAGGLRSPDYAFGRAIGTALLPTNDPALRQATPESIGALTLQDVQAYYRAAFRPDLTTIVVLGEITPAEARRVVMEQFGAWARPDAAPPGELPQVGPNAPSQARVPDGTRLQDRVAMTQVVGLPVTSPDRYTLELGNTILGGGFSSRLYKDLRVRTGYVYSVSSVFNWQRTRARYTVSFGADPGNVDKARALVSQNLRELQTTPVSEAELLRAKAEIMRQLPMLRASVGTTASVLLRRDELGLPLDSDQAAAQAYLAVTAPAIQQAFKTWLRPEGLAEVIQGPATP